MDITKFEVEHNIPKGEITKVLKKKYPSFSKVILSYARRSRETGVQLTPTATKYLKSIYEEPKERVKNTAISVRISKDLYEQLSAKSKEQNIPIEMLIKNAMDEQGDARL